MDHYTTQCHHCGCFIDDFRMTHAFYAHLCRSCGTAKEVSTKNPKVKHVLSLLDDARELEKDVLENFDNAVDKHLQNIDDDWL